MPIKILTPGHRYELPWFEGFTPEKVPTGAEVTEIQSDGTITIPGQVIQFIEKRQIPDSPVPGLMETVNNGTTNEAVLEVLIDRIQTMNAKFPCRENAIVLTHLETALLWLNKRTADRKFRGVEGKAAK